MKHNRSRLQLVLGLCVLLAAFALPRAGLVVSGSEAKAEGPDLLAATAQLVGSWDPTGANAHDGVFVQGNRAYMTDWGRDFDVVDISNPANPVWLGNLPLTGQGMDVVVDGNYAYVAMKSGGLRIVDVSNPFDMHQVGWIKADPNEDDLALHLFKSGNLVYVADEMFGVVIYNVSTPSSPTKVGVCAIGFAESVWVQGSYAYVTGGNLGLQIYDISNPWSPALRGSLPKIGYSYDVQVVGNYAYVTEGVSGLRVIDVSDATSPQHLTTVATASEAYDIRVADGYAYVSERNAPGHVEIFDLSNPAAPVLASRYQSTERVSGVYPAGGYVYCAAHDRGLLVLDPSLGPTATPTATSTPTATATPTMTATPSATPQPTPTIDPASTTTLTLQVNLQGRGDAPAPAWETTLHVSLVSPAGSPGPYTYDPVCDSSGSLTLDGVPQGVWDISVRDGSSLVNVRRGVILSGVSLSLDMETLLAGDTNLDGVINILDFSVLASVYGSEQGDERYQVRGDLNRDGRVNILDFAMLANNYGQAGPREL